MYNVLSGLSVALRAVAKKVIPGDGRMEEEVKNVVNPRH